MQIPDMTREQFDLMFKARPITIMVTGGMEKRLHALEQRTLRDDPTSTPKGEPWEETIKILIGACLDRGLTESEADEGLFYLQTGVPAKMNIGPRKRVRIFVREVRRATRWLRP